MATKKTTGATLEEALAEIDKTFGAGTIVRMGDDTVASVEALPTGIMELDEAQGIGGLPKGRIVEIYGPESSGKSTIALHVVASAQKLGLNCAYIDVEYALDPSYMEALGVDVDALYLSQPATAEQALEVVDRLAKSGHFGVIVIDSVSVLTPRAALEGEIGDAHIGLLARLMSDAMRKIVASAAKTGTIVFFINQIREKVGIAYGSPETTSGGRALKFYCSVRMDIRRGEQIKNGEEVIGNRTKVKMVKNKVGRAYRVAEFDIIYGRGVPQEGSLYNMAVRLGVIQKSGNWSNYLGENLANGADATKRYLLENPEVFDAVYEDVRKILDGGKA